MAEALTIGLLDFKDGQDLKLASPGVIIGTNDVILRGVFKLLSIDDLKVCRLVSHLWYDLVQPMFIPQTCIKLYFDKKEIKPTAKKFMNFFNDSSPLPVKFDGLCVEFGQFFWFEWRDDPIVDFLEMYGSQIKYLKIKVKEGENMDWYFLQFKNMLYVHIPQIEHLRVDIKLEEALSTGGPSSREPKTTDWDHVQLLNLHRIDWCVVPEWFDDREYTLFGSPEQLKELFTPVLSELIRRSPNLKSIQTDGNRLTLECFVTLSVHTLSHLKEISISPSTSKHPLHVILEQLTSLSLKGLRLSSFSVETNHDEETADRHLTKFFISLLGFLTTQKDCLKHLKINVRNYYISNYEKNIPRFPTFRQLEHLSISACDEMQDHWLDLFPNLNKLEMRYNWDLSEDFNKRQLMTSIRERLISRTNHNVHSVLFHLFTPYDEHSLELCNSDVEDDDYTDYTRLDPDLVIDIFKKWFPNAKRIKFHDAKNEIFTYNRPTESF